MNILRFPGIYYSSAIYFSKITSFLCYTFHMYYYNEIMSQLKYHSFYEYVKNSLKKKYKYLWTFKNSLCPWTDAGKG